MAPYGKHYHPLGLSGGHAGCDVLSYTVVNRPWTRLSAVARSGVSREAALGAAQGATLRKTVQWSIYSGPTAVLPVRASAVAQS